MKTWFVSPAGEPRGARAPWGMVASTACIVLLAAAIFASLPVQSHGTPGSGEANGHDETFLDPLTQFEFIGPKGSKIENKPCFPALNLAGPQEGEASSDYHIGHNSGVQGLNPYYDGTNWIQDGSINLWHFDSFEDPRQMEGPYISPSFSAMLGVDGFARGRMEFTVVDGQGNDGYDLEITDYHPWSSYCVYGSEHEEGPWIFAGSAFYGESGKNQITPVDLKYYYTPLYNEHIAPGPGRLDYVLLVASLEKYPGLDAHFGIKPLGKPLPLKAGEAIKPNTKVNFVDNYPSISTVKDPASSRYGFPARQSTEAPCAEDGTILGLPPDVGTTLEPLLVNTPVMDLCRQGLVTSEDMKDSSPDPIVNWEWWFDTDKTGYSSIDMTKVADFTASGPGSMPAMRQYKKSGEYEVCLRVTTQDGMAAAAATPPPKLSSDVQDTECQIISVSDVPPIVAFSAVIFGCNRPHVDFLDASIKPDDGKLAEWHWDYGDGTTATGPNGTHAYKESGSYNVTLRVIAEDGSEATLVRALDIIGKAECPDPASLSDMEVRRAATPKDGVDMAIASTDTDGDGLPDAQDACPYDPTQTGDADRDGLGDVCDDDADADGIPNRFDGCPLRADPLQEDADGDAEGDVCDLDADADGIGNATDLCLLMPDPGQEDTDADGLGDACDGDIDGDGHANPSDAFPFDPDEWSDLDGDHVGDNAQRLAGITVQPKARATSSSSLKGVPADGLWIWVGLGMSVLLVAIAIVAFLRARRE